MVTVYSGNDCMQCKFTKMILDNQGIEYKEINIDENEEARQELKAQNFMGLPVVMREGFSPISGNNPMELNKMIADLA